MFTKVAAILILAFTAAFTTTALVEASSSTPAQTPASACASVTSAPWTTVVDGTQYLCTWNGAPIAL